MQQPQDCVGDAANEAVSATVVRELRDALSKNEAMLRSIVDNVPAFITKLDPYGTITFANWTIPGRPMEVILGRNAAEFAMPEHRDLLRSILEDVARTGETRECEILGAEPDGSPRPYCFRVAPIRDETRRGGMISVATDVYDRQQMEAALRQSEARLLEAQRIAHLGNWVWDVQPNKLHWSEEIYRIFGLPPDEFAATYEAFLQMVHVDDRPQVELAVEQSLFHGMPYSIDFRIARPLGEIRHVHTQAEVTLDASGHPVRMAGTVQDITDRVRAEQQARNLQNELAHVGRVSTMGEMAAGFAHELNQPLAAIASFADAIGSFLKSGTKADEAHLKRALEGIETQSLRAGEIVRRIRRLVSKSPPQRSRVDINPLVDEILETLRSDLRLAEIELVLERDQSMPQVSADAIQIQQVLLNLIRNAMDAVCSRGTQQRTIMIGTSHDEDRVHVTVRDTGPGIPPDVVEMIFDTFYTTKEHGLGMGLAISRSIIVSHGGRLWAEATPGVGATLRFAMPIARP